MALAPVADRRAWSWRHWLEECEEGSGIIDDIIKVRRRNGRLEALVHWVKTSQEWPNEWRPDPLSCVNKTWVAGVPLAPYSQRALGQRIKPSESKEQRQKRRDQKRETKRQERQREEAARNARTQNNADQRALCTRVQAAATEQSSLSSGVVMSARERGAIARRGVSLSGQGPHP